MSSKRWPHGTLAAALTAANARFPWATAPQLATIVDCNPGCARAIVRGLGLPVPVAKPARIDWTAEMKAALVMLAGGCAPVGTVCETLGVAPSTALLGALEVIRDLTDPVPVP